MSFYSRFGKIEYITATLPDVEWKYSYSAKQLQKDLTKSLCGKKLSAIFVDLDGYLRALHNERDIIDLSYLGGSSLMVFEKTVLQIMFHVEGMLEYRLFPIWELKLKRTTDYAPDDMACNENYFFDVINHDITCEYSGKLVTEFTVKGTNTWAFHLSGFDETAADAAEQNDLPAVVDFLVGDCHVVLLSDSIEYYWVGFKTITHSDGSEMEKA